MRLSPILQVVVLLSFTVPATVWGSAITGQPVGPAVESQDSRSDERLPVPALEAGSLFDDIGPLILVSAPTYLQLEMPSATDFASESSATVFQDIVASGSTSDLGNVGFQLAISSPGLVAPASVPETPTLLLLAPALGFAVRRLVGARRTRS